MNRLSPEAVTQLRNALTQWISADAGDDAALGHALQAVAADARERGVYAEQLLVVLKTMWFEIGGGPVAPPQAGVRRLDELVTACIKAYYS